MTAKKCKNCARYARKNSEYCWDCDPTIPAEEKLEAKRRGGLRTRKIPLPEWFDVSNYLPLTPQNLKRYFGDLLKVAHQLYQDDASQFFKAQREILPKASEFMAIESLLELEARTERLEQGSNGNKLLTGDTEDDVTITIESENAD